VKPKTEIDPPAIARTPRRDRVDPSKPVPAMLRAADRATRLPTATARLKPLPHLNALRSDNPDAASTESATDILLPRRVKLRTLSVEPNSVNVVVEHA
jgi:hypothetical protein